MSVYKGLLISRVIESVETIDSVDSRLVLCVLCHQWNSTSLELADDTGLVVQVGSVVEVELLLMKIPESELIVLSSDEGVVFGVGWDSSRSRLIGLSIAIDSPDRRDDLELKSLIWE